MDRIANVITGHIDCNVFRNLIGFADEFQFMANHVQYAATLQTRRCFFVDEVHRHVDFDLRILVDAKEIDVRWAIRNRMKRNVFWQRNLFFATKLEFDHTVHEVAGHQ